MFNDYWLSNIKHSQFICSVSISANMAIKTRQK